MVCFVFQLAIASLPMTQLPRLDSGDPYLPMTIPRGGKRSGRRGWGLGGESAATSDSE